MQILPQPDDTRRCPDCEGVMLFRKILWQGIHICAVDHCERCGKDFASDLPYGQAAFTPYQVNLSTGAVYGPEDCRDWFGKPLAEGLMSPDNTPIALHRTGDTGGKQRARVLCCLDHVYGHALLKLFNATAELDARAEGEALIVIVQPALAWLVPQEADAVWTVDLPFGEAAQRYYPALDTALQTALEGFEVVTLCPAWSHPEKVTIERFTGVPTHDFAREDYRVTYIWRGKRGWADHGAVHWAGKKLGMHALAAKSELKSVTELFEALRAQFPKVRFTVAGFGRGETFPDWIDDQRMETSSDEAERAACRVYSESRLVIGPHGSNMLLPTAHAGMALTLMPDDRWANLAQDTVLWGDDLDDPRLAVWRYRYVPVETTPATAARIASLMLSHYPIASLQFRAARLHTAGVPVTTAGLTAERLHRERSLGRKDAP